MCIRDSAHSLNLMNQEQWFMWTKSGERPLDIPTDPKTVYKDKGWNGMGDWLGTGNIFYKEWRPFKEARDYARSLKLKNKDQWFVWTKSGERPFDIPTDPSKVYKNEGWNGYGDWLGTGNKKRGHKG